MMYKLPQINILTVSLCTLLFASQAQANLFSEFNYYAGGGVGFEQIRLKTGYGEGFFPDSTSEFELLLGGVHANTFGFEVGVSATPEKHRDTYIGSGQAYPGNPYALPAGAWEIWRPYYSSQAAFAGVTKVFYLNQSRSCSVFLFAGGAVTKVETHIDFVNDDLPGDPSVEHITAARRDFNATRLVPVLKVGIEYRRDIWACRASYAWKNYAAFKMKSKQNPNGLSELRLNNVGGLYLDFLIYI